MRFSFWCSGAAMVAGLSVLSVPALVFASAQAVPPATQQLPAGPGRETFVKVCSGCHLTTMATTQRKSADDWATVVIDMRNRGANGSDEDMDAIVGYLATNFGTSAPSPHINVNTGAAADIAGALSLTLDQAKAIVAYREKNGNFKDLASLKQVPGTDVAKMEAAKDRIDF